MKSDDWNTEKNIDIEKRVPFHIRHIKEFFLALIFIAVIASSVAGCTEDRQDPDSVNESDLWAFERQEALLTAENIDVLSIGGSKVFKESSLNLIKAEDGLFYGLGHWPSGDGLKKKSMFTFDFNGTYQEKFEGETYFYAEAQEDPQGSGIYYYFQYGENGQVQFMKADYNNFSDEPVAVFTGDVDLRKELFAFDGEHLYYCDNSMGAILRRNMESGETEELFSISGSIDEIFLVHGELFIVTQDTCIGFDQNGQPEMLVNGVILGRHGGSLYHLDDQGDLWMFSLVGRSEIRCRDARGVTVDYGLYDKYRNERLTTGKFYFTSTEADRVTFYEYDEEKDILSAIAEAETGGNYAAFSDPVFAGNITAVVDNAGTLCLWDSAEKEVVYRSDGERVRGITGAYQDRYLVCRMENGKQGVLDLREQVQYVLDLSELELDWEGSWIFYVDDRYFYGRWTCDWDLGEEEPDVFYRIAVGDLSRVR